MNKLSSPLALSVIIPVGERYSDPRELYAGYLAGLGAIARPFEVVFVLDGPREAFEIGLRQLAAQGERFTVIALTRPFGESTALMAGFEQAKGEVILTLPAYDQIDGSDLPRLLTALSDCDIAIARRWPRAGGAFERLRRRTFHGLLAWVTGLRFNDLGCGARAFDRRVLEEIQLYGDQHRFLPVLADRNGFRVREVEVRQSPRDQFRGFYEPRVYARGLLDIFTIFFLVRFTKKPLRFFGMIGVCLFAFGALLVAWLVVERLLFSQELTQRPALLLSTLMVVLGLQLFALGLLGELIIFTHAKQLRDYQIDRVIAFEPDERNSSMRSGS
jgi:glycosyltransferase involved in cell wall biosynthesis